MARKKQDPKKETVIPTKAEEQHEYSDLFPEISDEDRTILEFDAIDDGIVEIVPGMTVEEITPAFALIQAPYRIWQLNSSGHRYYYRFDEQGNPEFFASVTTVLSLTLPKSKYLLEWIAKTGLEEAERYRDERGYYGTFMHAEYQKLVINRSYDFDDLKRSLKNYIEYNRLPDNFIYHADELKKDILAFAQFIIDYDIKPLAVEIALVHPTNKYAGMIDLPCSMLTRIGGKERMYAIIDFKSGRKGFYEESEIQLHMYRAMWNENFPKYQIEKVFNFSPKDWRKRPSYNLKDQTDSVNAHKIPGLLHIAAIEDGKKDNTFTAISGVINLDENKKLTDNVVSLTLSELIKSKPIKESKAKAEKETKSAAEKIEEVKETPKPATRKATIVKRSAVEREKPGKVTKSTTKRTIAADKKESPAKRTKTSRGGAGKPKAKGGINLLSDDLDI